MRVGVDGEVVEVVEEGIDCCLDHGALACPGNTADDLLDWEGRPDFVPTLAPPRLRLGSLDGEGMVVHLLEGNNLAFACQDEDLSSSYVIFGDIQLMLVLAEGLVGAPGDTLLFRTAGAYETPDAATDQGGETGAAGDGYQFHAGHF